MPTLQSIKLFLTPSLKQSKTWLLGTCVVLAFLVNLHLPRDAANHSLDSSWSQVLLHGLMQHVQWGPELSFTYGPLGFVTPYMGYVAGTFGLYLIAQWAIATLYAFSTWHALHGTATYQQFGFAVVLITFGFWTAGDAAWLSAFALSHAALSHLVESKIVSRQLTRNVALVDLFPALLPLVKTTLFLPWLVWLLTGTFICFLAHRRSVALWHLFLGVAIPFLAWLACGQSVTHLLIFLRNSTEIAIGYATSMQLQPDNTHVDDFALIAAALSSVILAGYVMSEWRNLRKWLTAAMFATVLACAFKLGLTRADWLHLPVFSAASLLTMSALPTAIPDVKAPPSRTQLAAVILGAAFALAIAAAGTFASPGDLATRTLNGSLTFTKIGTLLDFLANPGSIIRIYKRKAADYDQASALPKIHRLVGSERVDVLSYEQGTAYANHLNQAFRPVFQSYSAYTPALMELNDAFYGSPSAPEWVIFKLQSIDDRLPSEDDALLFSRIATTYTPVLVEKEYLLLKRQADSGSYCETQSEISTILAAGQWQQLGDAKVIKVKINLALSWRGKLKTLILRSPIAAIEVRDENAQVRRYRLLRANATSGFMLSPLLENTKEYLDWCLGKPPHRAVAFRVVPWNSADYDKFSEQIPISVQTSQCVQASIITKNLKIDISQDQQ